MKANPGTEHMVEPIARVIARALGHNDDTGMYWERYVLPARRILDEFRVWSKTNPKGGG